MRRDPSGSAENTGLESGSMMPIGGWIRLALLTAGLAAPMSAQQLLNPIVVVREQANAKVPTDCEQGLIAAAPRVAQMMPEPVPLPEDSPQVANQDVAQSLRRLQALAEAGNREGFVDALAEARAATNAVPPGGQRDAAREALRVESDIDRLWSFSLNSPTGAFFDASTEAGALVAMLKQYPEYGRSIADATLEVGGQTLYPTRESRQFLIRQAATRLLRLGIHSAPREPRTPLIVRTEPLPEPRPASSSTASTPPVGTSGRSGSSTPAATPVDRPGHPKNGRGVEQAGGSSQQPKGSSAPNASSQSHRVPTAGRSHAHAGTTHHGTKRTAGAAGASSRPTQVATALPRNAGSASAASTKTSGPIPPAPRTQTSPGTTRVVTQPSAAGSPSATTSSTPRSTTSDAATGTASGGPASSPFILPPLPTTGPPRSTPVPPSSTAPVASPQAASSTSATSSSTTSTSASATTATPSAPMPTATRAATTTTGSEETQTTTTASSGSQRGGRLNLIFAVILIFAGIALLVVFLRASG